MVNFSSLLSERQSRDFGNAMALMNNQSFDGGVDPASGAEWRMKALEKANAWTDRSIAQYGGTGDFMAEMQGQAANAGIQMVASNSIHEANKKAAEAAQRAAQTSGIGGLISQGLGIGLSLLCERRLKTDIEPLDAANAWEVVRDLPLYSFHYKANPGPTVYGPMIDEVEPLDPSLVRLSGLPDDEEGPIRGFDVMRFQAYESAALRAALHRIEMLEGIVYQMQEALARPRGTVAATVAPIAWTPVANARGRQEVA